MFQQKPRHAVIPASDRKRGRYENALPLKDKSRMEAMTTKWFEYSRT